MTGSVQLVRSSALSNTVDYAYAATATKDSRLIFLAGACPLDNDGTTAAIGDYAGQAEKCIETMISALAAAGAGIGDVTIRVCALLAPSKRILSQHGPWYVRLLPSMMCPAP